MEMACPKMAELAARRHIVRRAEREAMSKDPLTKPLTAAELERIRASNDLSRASRQVRRRIERKGW